MLHFFSVHGFFSHKNKEYPWFSLPQVSVDETSALFVEEETIPDYR